MESTVRSVTSLEWSTGNTKFEAWPVDPPGSGSGPLSSWTMSRHPSSARWLTAALPTTPAPMTTMSARSGICAMASCRPAAGTPVRSLSAVAYSRLRDLVVTLELPPGAVLEERQLMERLQLGRTPVREAVRRLSGEGLVRIFARRGTVVAPVDVRDLTHVSEVRTDLEALGAKLAAQRADSADRSRARELLDEIGAAPLTALSATPGPEPVRSLIR